MFGPRGGGVSLLVGFLLEASNKRCCIAPVAHVRDHLAGGKALMPKADVVFVELVEPADALAAVHNGHINPANDGVLVKVIPNGFWPDDPTWLDREREFEALIRTHSVPHAAVINEYNDPMSACVGIAKAAKLKS